MTEPVIEVQELKRHFLSRTGALSTKRRVIEALKGVSFQVFKGELFGYLGPNGAGKTTTVKILTTLLAPSSGTAKVLGLDVFSQARAIRRRINFVFGGERGLYFRLSGWDNLRYFADLYFVPPAVQKRRISFLLELVGLSTRAQDKVETYSRGMCQRLHIARGLINDPEVLFLDEPTIGLDPVAAFELRQVIKGVVKEGKTVFLTTHYMKEAEELCDRIAIINDGQIVALDTPSNLKQYARLVPVIEFAVEGMSERHLAKIRAIPEVQAATLDDVGMSQVLKVQSSRGSELIQPLMALLPDVRFGGVKVREPTLEDAYIQLVGGKV